MKKNLLIFCAILTTLSLTAFGYISWNAPVAATCQKTACSTAIAFDNDPLLLFNKPIGSDFFLKISPRFIHTITKEKLHQATSIIDILPEKANQWVHSYQAVKVTVLDGEEEISERGIGDQLNAAQSKLVQSANYSTDFYIEADYSIKNDGTGALEKSDLVYYFTVVPEKAATYEDSMDKLLSYLKEQSSKKTAYINQYDMKPGKLRFTVTQNGNISNVRLSSTTGYPEVDQQLFDLISEMPGRWNPATNSKGEKVDQELVLSFGSEGC